MGDFIKAGYDGFFKKYFIVCSKGIYIKDINYALRNGYKIYGSAGLLLKERDTFIEEILPYDKK